MEERIGFFICHCGVETEQYIRVEEIAWFGLSFPGVVVSQDYVFMCSDHGKERIIQDIKEHKLTRIVVAACSPRMHAKTFRDICEKAGLDHHKNFHMLWIHDHGAWLHQSTGEATKRAMNIVRAGLTHAGKGTHKYAPRACSVNTSTLIVGGGIAGMQAALDIAKAGNKVYLVEQQATIGGHMLQYDKTFPTLDCAACIGTPKMVEVSQHKNIELLTYSEVEKVDGFVGNFRVRVKKKASFVKNNCTGCGACAEVCPVQVKSEWDVGTKLRKAIYIPFPQAVPVRFTIDKDACINCNLCVKKCKAEAIDHEMTDTILNLEVGAIVIATGFDPMDPQGMKQYGYGKFTNVFTNLEFERLSNATGPTSGKLLKRDKLVKPSLVKLGRRPKIKPQKYTEPPKSVAIIHCVGSRDINHHEYCSRTCCMYGLKYAHLLKDKCGEDVEVYNFYIDMRCFGKGYEEFYNKVQSEGVRMIRGKVGSIKEKRNGNLLVKAEDTFLSATVEIEVEMVILCNAMEARADSKQVAGTFGLTVGEDGFFQERHAKMSPVSTAVSGIFMAGACQGPKDIPDTVAQAKAAASECISLSTTAKVEVPEYISVIDESACNGCKLCVQLCPYGAIDFDNVTNKARVNPSFCHGCGSCIESCEEHAISTATFDDHKEVFEGILAN